MDIQKCRKNVCRNLELCNISQWALAQTNGRGPLRPQIGNLGPPTIIIEFTLTSLKILPSVGKTEPNIKKIKFLCTVYVLGHPTLRGPRRAYLRDGSSQGPFHE